MRFTKSIIVSLTILFSFLYTQEVVMGLGSYDGSSAEITMDTPFDVGGFQFNAVGANVTGKLTLSVNLEPLFMLFKILLLSNKSPI